MAIDQQPNNTSFLSPVGFKFVLKRAPNLTYFGKAASLPDLSLGEPPQENVFIKIPVPGDRLVYSPLNIRFGVDEDLKNYLEVFNWMVGLGFPDSFDDSIHKDPNTPPFQNIEEEKVVSDGSLIILTSDRTPNIRVNFEDMFPIALTSLQFDIAQMDITYLESDVTFTYRKFTIEIL